MFSHLLVCCPHSPLDLIWLLQAITVVRRGTPHAQSSKSLTTKDIRVPDVTLEIFFYIVIQNT